MTDRVAPVGPRLAPRLGRLVGAVSDYLSVRRVAVRFRLGQIGEVDLLTFRGHGTREQLRLQVRVIEAPGLRPSTVHDPWWRNVLAAYHRFVSLEVPGAIVRAQVDGEIQETTTDYEGYARFVLPNTRPDDHGWRPVEVRLIAPLGPGQDEIVRAAQVLVPDARARIGIISDVDDTVLYTGITRKIEMFRSTLLYNAHTRTPFAGVAPFYRALHDGDDARRPIFYVSGSPWNLYDMIDRFVGLQDIPPGPFFLREWGIDETKFIHVSGRSHKLAHIELLLRTYPELKFVLIGDSGEEDPEIYADIVEAAPDRIAAVYIRNVTVDDGRIAAVRRLLATLADHDVPSAFGASTVTVAEHAAAHDLIDPAAVDAIRMASLDDGS